jgi:hypothetical protein
LKKDLFFLLDLEKGFSPIFSPHDDLISFIHICGNIVKKGFQVVENE